MKDEHRDLFYLPSTLLYKQDLFDLEKELLSSNDSAQNDFEIRLTSKNRVITVSSIRELFQASGLPQTTDKLSIDYKLRGQHNNERCIVGGVSLTMYYNYVSCYVSSYDEDWFRGKIARVRVFFAAKKPWYALIIKVVPFVIPAFVMLPFLFAALSLGRKEYVSAASSLVSLILLSSFCYLVYSKRIFPYVKIVLSEKCKKQIDWNGIWLIIAGLASLLVIIDYVLKFMQFIRLGK